MQQLKFWNAFIQSKREDTDPQIWAVVLDFTFAIQAKQGEFSEMVGDK